LWDRRQRALILTVLELYLNDANSQSYHTSHIDVTLGTHTVNRCPQQTFILVLEILYPRHLAAEGRITQWLHLREDSQCAGQPPARAMRIVQWLIRTTLPPLFDWNQLLEASGPRLLRLCYHRQYRCPWFKTSRITTREVSGLEHVRWANFSFLHMNLKKNKK
jgi:hypothetical protein